ncbi:TCR/Tet family MFS transporter [Stieleria varia]|uniref:Tetracycline resistance protein, class C n=1 Tax=Stieleria varia TaxID=2528005 RepID=A0A5C6BBJ8_9BACT|nr:TCR/Tet family MFS transporter [Stieleria varia]TWU07904.1 Tetracycline resistance protein, class C [Stieleria varia]
MSNSYPPSQSSDESAGDGSAVVPPQGPRTAGIAFILLTLFIDILGIGIVIPVLPELVKELIGGDESDAAGYVAVIAASYAAMQFIFSPIVGSLSDRFGRRPVLLMALFGLGIDFVIQGFAPSVTWLFVGRLLAGVMGASFTTANAYIADVSTDDTRARNFGFVGVMFGLGFIVGPALGGVLGGISLRLPFFVAAGLALVNWLYGFFILPESLPPEKRSEFSLRKANPFGAMTTLRKYPLAFGVAIVFVCKSLSQRGLENVWVLFTSAKFDWSEQTNGLMLGWVGLTALIVQGGMVRPAVKRFGERKTLIAGTLISAIAFLAYGLASAGWMIPVIVMFGALGGLAGPAIQSLVTSTVDEKEQGQVQGALTSLMSLTSIVAPLLFTGGLFKYFTSDAAPFQMPGAPFIAGSAILFASLFIAIAVFRKYPQ